MVAGWGLTGCRLAHRSGFRPSRSHAVSWAALKCLKIACHTVNAVPRSNSGSFCRFNWGQFRTALRTPIIWFLGCVCWLWMCTGPQGDPVATSPEAKPRGVFFRRLRRVQVRSVPVPPKQYTLHLGVFKPLQLKNRGTASLSERPTYHERVIGGVGSRPELGPPTPQNWPDLRPPNG